MRADVGDPALTLALDGRLIGAAAREIVKADTAHVVRFVLRRGAECEQRANNEKPGALSTPGRLGGHVAPMAKPAMTASAMPVRVFMGLLTPRAHDTRAQKQKSPVLFRGRAFRLKMAWR